MSQSLSAPGARRSRRSPVRRLRRRLASRHVKNLVFFVLMMFVSVGVGYCVSRYEPGLGRAD